jgi:hypothetical protein
LCLPHGHHHRLWMDPLAMWVDLEPPLTAAGSGPAMAAAASQGTERVEGDATAGCETLSLCGKEQSSMLLGTSFRVRRR